MLVKFANRQRKRVRDRKEGGKGGREKEIQKLKKERNNVKGKEREMDEEKMRGTMTELVHLS